MDPVQVAQKIYEMPPKDGFTVAQFSPSPTSSARCDFMKRSSEAGSIAEATVRALPDTSRSATFG